MCFGLGGFAEDESVVDGDFEAFNYCLAEHYYDAMIGEDWNLLDGMNESLVEKIIYWLSYDDEIVKESNYDLDGIVKGTLLTINDRTIIEAIVSEKIVWLAEVYIRLGVKDFRLYVLYMLYYNDKYNLIDYVYKGTILNAYLPENRDELVKFLSDVLNLLDTTYKNILEVEKKIEFLDIVKSNFNNFKYSKNFGIIDFNDICDHGFARILINK